jgi:signal peptide peptidase SppA
MPRNYDHVLSFALDHPWAITRPMLTVVAGIIAQHIAGVDDRAAIEAAIATRQALPQPTVGSVAIIPMHGVIAPRLNVMSEMSGGTTFEKLTSQLRECVANKAISTIVLDVDSPGGNVAGATEFAAELLKARTKKPVIGQVQYTGASAAYWALACCTSIVAAPSAKIGSVGVYASHDDISEALKKLGVTRTFISAGGGKVDGNEASPLTDSARSRFTAMVEGAYATMVADIVKGRGAQVTAARVRDDWQAHLYSTSEALSLGLIDRVATLDETMDRLLGAAPADDLTAARTIVPPLDTPQEPARATGQDRSADAAIEREIYALTM